jgi:prevent-host-death family protein
MPISTASRKGVSAVAAAAEDERVVLTSHGRVVAVVDSAERLDEQARLLREARLVVLDAAGDLVSSRGLVMNLDQVCERLGLDPQLVRDRATTTQASLEK